ncbi:13140_t:CDS:2, partial [Racocetra persica]
KEIPENLQISIQEQFQYSGLKGKLGEVRMFYGLGGNDANIPKKIAVVALGINKSSEQSHNVSEALEITRKATAIGVRSLRELDVKHVGVDVMLHEHGAAEGATLGLYRFD